MNKTSIIGIAGVLVLAVFLALLFSGAFQLSVQDDLEKEWYPTQGTCTIKGDCVNTLVNAGSPRAWAEENSRCVSGVCELLLPESGGG